MQVLLTGSSGWLGQTLAPRLRDAGHRVIGLDVCPGRFTTAVGSVADRALIDRTMRDHAITAVVHAGALHKPDIVRCPASEFISVNVQGTQNLLEAATACGVDRFVMTSTTSLMISNVIREGRAGGATKAAWITEDLRPLQPRNIYGITKFAAEHLCRMAFQDHGLPVVVLRTARFFPEEDDMAHEIEQSAENTKANEFLFRRLTVEDAAEAHMAALERAPSLGFDTFIVSAPTPFKPEDCEELIADAPSVVARYFPHYHDVYRRRGWTMFHAIDRVYSARRAEERLGFRCKTGFAEILAGL
ncbi:MAG: NAD(P)-dependent oxidoreductase [Alphaproteobacteria bacterium]|nr:NAD(P)-dependent oxidoreductase [Alphaproteobacteria bacterium]